MKEWKSIFGLLLLFVGGFVLYKVLPVYWSDFQLGRMLEEQAINYTYNSKSDQEIANAIAEKAHDLDVPLAPEEITVVRGGGDLMISTAYTVHVDLPFYPLDLNFKTSNKNKNIMMK
ncbi:MAG TPA: hypothetical protein VM578_01760 [Candidatus Saccharimonadales bacterium]|nr:hypothetical protein [Candidatus Saccharimonadales bacterium]